MTSRLVVRLATALLAVAASALSACGGGGGGDSATTLTLSPSTDLTLVANASAPPAGGLSVGDDALNVSLRAGLRFALTPFVPTGTVITSAKLRLHQAGVVGDPYGKLGAILVDRVDFGVSLNETDFAPTVLTPNLGTLSGTAAIGVIELDVTSAVAADLAANAFTSDFLLRFPTPATLDVTPDAARLEDSEASLLTGVKPVLIITYP